MKKGSSQSLAGAIRQRLAAIEARVAHGIRLEVIRNELAEEGFETTNLCLRNALWRARRQRKSESAAPRGETGYSPDTWSAMRSSPSSPPATTEAPVKPATTINPLLKPVGFVYEGTRGISTDDLI